MYLEKTLRSTDVNALHQVTFKLAVPFIFPSSLFRCLDFSLIKYDIELELTLNLKESILRYHNNDVAEDAVAQANQPCKITITDTKLYCSVVKLDNKAMEIFIKNIKYKKNDSKKH